MHIEMLGFAPLQQDLTAVAGAPSPELELKMLPFADMRAEVRLAVAPLPDPTPAAPAPGKPAPGKPAPAKPAGAKPAGFQRTEVNASTTPAATNTQEPQPAIASAAASSSDLAQRAADGFLVNGSVNNGAASPFAQLARFGNGIRGPRSLYQYGVGFTFDTSRLNARDFSLNGQDTPKPDYSRFQGLLSFGGPIKIRHILRNGPNLTVTYQWVRNNSGRIQTGLMPTPDQRNGIFATPIIDPLTGNPFPNNVIPQTRISPQARSLLTFYPQPNFQADARYNYQIPIIFAQHQDSM